MILQKLGIRMSKEDGEALKKSADETRQVLLDMGVKPEGDGSTPTSSGGGSNYGAGDNNQGRVGNKI